MTKPKSKPAAKKAAPKKKPAAKAETPEQRADRLELERLRKRRERWQAWAAHPESCAQLCDFIANNGAEGNLAAFSRAMDFPYATLFLWLESDPERAKAYDKARMVRADVLADAVIQVANEKPSLTLQGSIDGGSVNDKRLRIDALKWAAGKLNPRRYGEKVAIGGADDLPPMQTQVSGELSISPADAYKKLIGA